MKLKIRKLQWTEHEKIATGRTTKIFFIFILPEKQQKEGEDDIVKQIDSFSRKIPACIIFLLGISQSSLFCQKAMLTGTVLSTHKKQPLEAVTVHDISTNTGVFTNLSGAFSIELAEGMHKIEFSRIGFRQLDTIINFKPGMNLSVFLKTSDITPGGVTITAANTENNASSAGMSQVIITRKEILKAPSLLGESDPLGLLRYTPGVSSGSEGSSGFFVRGGTADQNLILLDNISLYNPGHLLGFFSVFNPEIIRNVKLLKSGIPARYGGRLSSVIMVESYKGNPDSLETAGSIGLISGRLSLTGPLPGKKGTFVASARRTYLGLLVGPAIRKLAGNDSFLSKNNNYEFNDLNASLTYPLTPNDFITGSAYTGRDRYRLLQENVGQVTSLKWGNDMASLTWNHNFGNGNYWKTGLSYSGYSFSLKGSQKDYLFGLLSAVSDVSFSSDVFTRKRNLTFSYGLGLTEHSFIPNRINAEADEFFLSFGQFSKMHALEGGIYADAEFPLSARLSASAGLRISFFSHHGPYTAFNASPDGLSTDTVRYSSWEPVTSFLNPEPRLVLNYAADDNNSFKVSYMRTAQYVHLATSSAISLPTDIWIPSTSGIKPMTANQFSAGYFRSLAENSFELSGELYYKRMSNKPEFLRGIVYNSVFGKLEDNITSGFARSYGFELMFRKNKGNLTGWVTYTLAKTEQRFSEINQGRFYPAKYDRRHDLAATASYQLNKKWSFSSVFVFASGSAYTVPVGRYVIQGNIVNEYDAVNSFRMPSYHRLDISVTRKTMIMKRLSSELNFSVYNVYNRINPYFVYFVAKGDIETYSLDIKAHRAGLFPAIPSVSWNFNF